MDNRCSISLEARFKLYLKISNKLSKHTLNKLIAKNPKISSHGIAYLTFCSYWPLKSAFSEIFLILDAKALQLKNSIEIDFLAWTTVLHQVIKPHICHFSPQMYFLGSIFLHMKARKLWQNLPKSPKISQNFPKFLKISQNFPKFLHMKIVSPQI